MDKKKQSLMYITIIVLLMALVSVTFRLRMEETNVVANTQGSLSNNSTTMDNNNVTELKIDVLQEGSGPESKNGDNISVDYTGMLTDGKVFDSSVGRAPFTLTLGAGQVIKGWEQGLLGMKVGEKRKLTIPSDLAYGKSGYPGAIPPDATLVFDVELKAIK